MEGENKKLAKENNFLKKEVEDVNATLKDEYERFSKEVNILHGRIDSFCNDVQLRDAPLSSLMYSKMLLRRCVNMLDKAERSARAGE